MFGGSSTSIFLSRIISQINFTIFSGLRYFTVPTGLILRSKGVFKSENSLKNLSQIYHKYSNFELNFWKKNGTQTSVEFGVNFQAYLRLFFWPCSLPIWTFKFWKNGISKSGLFPEVENRNLFSWGREFTVPGREEFRNFSLGTTALHLLHSQHLPG